MSDAMTAPQHGRVAVVTGASAGLGRAYAERLARDGADIVLADLQPANETAAAIEAIGRRTHFMATDVTNPQAGRRLVAETQAAFGRCDVWVDNAGAYPFVPFDDLTFEDWRMVMTLNLDAPFLLCKAFVPMMRAGKYGRIVNVSSSEGWTVAPNSAHYIASKMGVVGLTRALATEVAADGITVNAVAPGIVQGTTVDRSAPQYLEIVPELQAIKRPAEVQDLTAAVSFLASVDARHITAQTIVVDGGQVRL